MSGLFLARESFASFYYDAPALIERYNAEFPEQPLELDLPAYGRMEEAGLLRVFTLRKQGILRGYALFIVCRGLHSSKQVADLDLVYLIPECRDEDLHAWQLLAFAEGVLSAEGIARVYHHVRPHHESIAALTEQGYAEAEIIYAKNLTP